MYHDIPERLRALIEPVIHDHGFELVDAGLSSGRGPSVIRVVIDTHEGDGRVSIERCAEVSRELGTCIDADASMPTAYRLEVSSPGLDRVLGRERDFEAALGSEVRLETRHPIDGRRHFRGPLLGVGAGMVRMRVDGSEVVLPFAEVARANRVYEFTSADFGREKAARRRERRARRDASPGEPR
jgi:ribosome maturation factor RimP